jgi:hypothetical protein
VASINFSAPPTCSAFMKSESFGRLIAGPVGSGKTTACIMELLRRAIEQEPAPDGIRYTRFAIVRQTLKQLKDTVLKDITSWLKGICDYRVSENCVYVTFGDVRSEWLLIPLEDPDDQRRLLSMQLTGAWLSECIEMDVAVIPPLSGRVSRYPSAVMGGCTWRGLIADTNMPTEGSDWHKFMELDVPPDWQIFKQPGGRSEAAENLEWLEQTPKTKDLPPDDPARHAQGRIYYERAARNPDPYWVKRYVDAEYGPDPSGSAVFKESFRLEFHVTTGLVPSPGHPLIVAQDFGRNPCAIIGQVDHRGRVLVFEEVESSDMGLELHIQQRLRPALMNPLYLGRVLYVIGDPAGRAKNSSYEETSFDLLKREGFNAYPAPTNDLDKRLRAVEAMLSAQRDGAAALLIDKERCPKLVLALASNYRYLKRRTGGFAPLPEKSHPWSDLADALQYLCLVAHGGQSDYIARRMGRMGNAKVTQAPPVGAWT